MPIRYTKAGTVDKRSETSMKNLEKSSMYQSMMEKKKGQKNITEEPVVEKKEPPKEAPKEAPKEEIKNDADDEKDDDDDEDDEYEIQEKKKPEPVAIQKPPEPVEEIKKEETKKLKKKKKIVILDSDEEEEEEIKVVSQKKYQKTLSQFEKNMLDMKLKNEELKNSVLYNQHLTRLGSVATRQMKIKR